MYGTYDRVSYQIPGKDRKVAVLGFARLKDKSYYRQMEFFDEDTSSWKLTPWSVPTYFSNSANMPKVCFSPSKAFDSGLSLCQNTTVKLILFQSKGLDLGRGFIVYGLDTGLDFAILDTASGKCRILKTGFGYGVKTTRGGFMMDRNFMCV